MEIYRNGTWAIELDKLPIELKPPAFEVKNIKFTAKDDVSNDTVELKYVCVGVKINGKGLEEVALPVIELN